MIACSRSSSLIRERRRIASPSAEANENLAAVTKRIVVLGGGFAGVSAAQELARQLRREHRLAGASGTASDAAIEVLLLNRDNYFVFQPLLADIISGTIE